MKINLKLLIIFLEIALIPTILLTYITYSNSQSSLSNLVVNQLEATANIQKTRTLDVLATNQERLDLITSRLRLRTLTDNYNKQPSAKTSSEINSIIQEAKTSIVSIKSIQVVSLDGHVISSTDPSESSANYSGQEFFEIAKQKAIINDLQKLPDDSTYFRLAAPVKLNNELIGVIIVRTDSVSLANVFNDYHGLGDTGESILVSKADESSAVILSNLRSDSKAALNLKLSNTNVPISQATKGINTTLKNVDDYRGVKVLAVTRYIESAGWGVVVKMDYEEAFQQIKDLNGLLLFLTGAAVIVITVIALSVSRAIAMPVIKLKRSAIAMAGGNLDQHINAESSDEIGQLASAFNMLGAKLKQYYSSLENKVEYQTHKLKTVLEESETKNRELEKNKKAILNILEDLETERAMLSEIMQKDEALVSSIGDSIVVTDEYGNITKVNPEMEALLGYKENELVGRSINNAINVSSKEGDAVLPEDRVVFEALSTGQPAHAVYKLNRKDKSTLIADFTASPYLISGKPRGAVIIIRDVSQQSAIDKAKTEFVSLASHQLRTPLSTINWYLEMVLGGDAGKISSEQKKYLTEIYAANQRMVVLVNSLLNVSRIDLGTFAIEPTPIDLKEVVGNVISELQGQIQKKKMKIVTKFDDKLQSYNADPKLTHIIFQNLISNSVKYTPGKGTITITIANQTPSIMISVADNGFGIPKAQQAKIFTKLFRADNVVSKDTDGTGLGLYLLKAIVEEAGGKIGFTSKENVGTTFTIHLPLKGMKPREGTRGLSSVNA